MVWKSFVCFVIFTVVHCQGIPLDQARVCVNPKLYNYFTDEASHITPLLQPNVYTTRGKRSVARHVNGPREESTNEAHREPRRRDGPHEENINHNIVRREIDDTHSRIKKSTSHPRNKVDNEDSLVKNRRDQSRGNGRSRQRSRNDQHDRHGDRSRTHPSLPGTRGNDRRRQRRHGDHDTPRDRSRTHTNSRGDTSHRPNSLHSARTPNDKRRVFTDVKKS